LTGARQFQNEESSLSVEVNQESVVARSRISSKPRVLLTAPTSWMSTASATAAESMMAWYSSSQLSSGSWFIAGEGEVQ
jgi:hypothetical protein